jgi:hypothetical protein
MNRDQFNRSEMFNTVSAVMQSNSTAWSGTPALVTAVNDLNGKISAIAAKAGSQQTPITGAAAQKEQARNNVEAKTLEVADAIGAFAAANNDANLGAQVELTASTLDRMPDDALEETAQRIAGVAATNATALLPYGVTGDDVEELNNLTVEFHDMKTAPRAAVAGRAAQTETLPDLLTETTSLLRNRLDKLMTKYKRTNPVFFAAYRSARVIVDRGSGPAPQKQPAPPP